MTKSGFVKDILNFDPKKIKKTVKKKLKENYFTNEEFWNEAKVKRGFKTAVPLFKWVNSITSYKEILDNVQPLTDEITKLQKEEEELVTKSTINKKQLTEIK